MAEAFLLIVAVNAGLWLLLWAMAELEPVHPQRDPALDESVTDPSRWAERPDDHLGLTA